MTLSDRIQATLPEWEGFAHAVQARRPDSGTWCEGWTVRDLVIHQTGTAEELRRVLEAHMASHPVNTRAFEERERPYREMNNADLWEAFITSCEKLADLSDSALTALDPETSIEWTGRKVTPSFFAEHMRQELVLHRWDLTGDDATATHSLMQPWMTKHTVHQVGKPLLARGCATLNLNGDHRVEGRLRAPGTDDVLISASAAGGSIELVAPEGDCTLESDPATRVLFLWGRRPADPSRWHSQAGPHALGKVRTLLNGY